METKYLVTTREMFQKAYQEHYAIGAFNINHLELIQAVVEAAGDLRSPVILQASSFTAKYTDLEYLVQAADLAAKIAGIPVAMHLDHGEIQDDLSMTEELIPTMKEIFDVR